VSSVDRYLSIKFISIYVIFYVIVYAKANTARENNKRTIRYPLLS